MHTPRILAVVVALSLAAPQPLHAQDTAESYTTARADADIELVLHATGESYEAAHTRLMTHPRLALTQVYQRTAAGLTATERERLATLAEALAGTQAREQILDPPLQVVPPEPTPTTPPAPTSESLAVPMIKKPPGSPTRWRSIAVFGSVVLATGGVVTGIGINVLRKEHDPTVMNGPHSCGCSAVGGVFVGSGVLFAVVGALILGQAAKSRREWRAHEHKQTAQLAPAFGRSPRGTFTTGLELRF